MNYGARIVSQSFLLISCLWISNLSFAEQLSASESANVTKLIEIFNTNDAKTIAEYIEFPLIRETPLAAVKNSLDFQRRYNEIFDDNLRKKITTSKNEQWSRVGWRGVMLDDGVIWLNGAKISAVNYLSAAEKQRKSVMLMQQKHQLNPTLKKFKNPEIQFITPKFLVRIDQLKNDKYRYAAWKVNQPQSALPDIILSDGTMKFDGSGGNHSFIFRQGNYTYTVYRNLIGVNAKPEVTLEITQNAKVIFKEDGKIVEYK